MRSWKFIDGSYKPFEYEKPLGDSDLWWEKQALELLSNPDGSDPETAAEAAKAAHKLGYKYFAFRARGAPGSLLGSAAPAQAYGVAPGEPTGSEPRGSDADCDYSNGYDEDGFDFYKIHDVPMVDPFTEYAANPTFTPIFIEHLLQKHKSTSRRG